jgi:hypothetical protein
MGQRKPLTELLEKLDAIALAMLPEPAKIEVLVACAQYASSLLPGAVNRQRSKRQLLATLKRYHIAFVPPLPTAHLPRRSKR